MANVVNAKVYLMRHVEENVVDVTTLLCWCLHQMKPGWAFTPSRTATRCRRPTPRTAASSPPPASSTSSWASATPTSLPRPPPASQPGPRGWPSPTAEASQASYFQPPALPGGRRPPRSLVRHLLGNRLSTAPSQCEGAFQISLRSKKEM